MDKARYEMQKLNDLIAESEGQPGHRIFKIIAMSTSGSAILWLEKEQLYQLAIAIKQLLASLKQPDITDGNAENGEEFNRNIEFKAGALELWHDNSTQKIIIYATDISPDTQFDTTLRIWVTSDQARKFAEESLNLCASGRPLCPLCSEPTEDGIHSCPRSNGHAAYLQQ